VLINHFYTFKEADFRYRLLALLLTLRFRTDKTLVADASLSRRARLPAGERRAASSALLRAGSRLSRFPVGVE